LMGWYSIRVGNRYKSMALIAGGKHLQSDTYSTIGLVLGLLLLQYTQLSWIDSALAILFGGFIIFAGLSILRKTVTNLLDGADEELLEQIAQSINDSRRNDWIDIHNTKVIKSGNQLYIDCDLTLPWFYNLEEGHESCERLKNTFETKLLHRVQVSIHTDPCGRNRCAHCRVEKCMSRIRLFESSEKISILQLVQSDDERNS
ncbi:MAG: cation diffusion facilitator family transporter, partial [Phocaeicola sp.]